MPVNLDNQGGSTRPYLLRALHDWCTDNGFTPYLAVHVGEGVQVPREYVKNNEIVLNVSFEATSNLQLGNQFIEFKARFGGVTREIVVPVDHVVAIYARENGQGMAFPVPTAAGAAGPADAGATEAPGPRTGLRLASSEPDAVSVPREAAPGSAEPPQAPEPDPAGPAPAGGRPSLKRIK